MTEPIKILNAIQHPTYFVPTDGQTLMHQDVAETCQRCQVPRKVRRSHTQLTHAQDGIVIVDRLLSAFQGDDAVTNVNASLSGNLKVALNDVKQVGSLVADIS